LTLLLIAEDAAPKESIDQPQSPRIGRHWEDTHLESMGIPVHAGVNPESTQLMIAITQMVTTMAQDQEASHPTEGRGCTLKDFYSHNSDNLDGSGDHFST
jgi:hypothetical protein